MSAAYEGGEEGREREGEERGREGGRDGREGGGGKPSMYIPCIKVYQATPTNLDGVKEHLCHASTLNINKMRLK